MKVFTKWPALVPAIRRAGHEPVLIDSETEPEPMAPLPFTLPVAPPLEPEDDEDE